MVRIKKRIALSDGFTLVEIIVVLVVLAILAAFTIPTMLGFVSDARGKALIPEAREVYVAAQTVASEYSGTTTFYDGEGVSGAPATMNDGDPNSIWYGLTNSLSSTRVRSRYDAWKDKTDKPQYNYSRVKISRQMYNYLSKDIKISSFNLIEGEGKNNVTPALTMGESAWRVTVGAADAAGKTGKVTKVVYFKNNYRITIEGNNATVEKY